jgi:hypothetical protein
VKPEFLNEDDETPTSDRVTVGVSDDSPTPHPPHTQIVISFAEARAMMRMPGGICFTNWLRIRGLDDEPVKES